MEFTATADFTKDVVSSCLMPYCKTIQYVDQWSESLTTNHEVPGSIPGSTVGIFLEGEDSRGDHGLGRLV